MFIIIISIYTRFEAHYGVGIGRKKGHKVVSDSHSGVDNFTTTYFTYPDCFLSDFIKTGADLLEISLLL